MRAHLPFLLPAPSTSATRARFPALGHLPFLLGARSSGASIITFGVRPLFYARDTASPGRANHRRRPTRREHAASGRRRALAPAGRQAQGMWPQARVGHPRGRLGNEHCIGESNFFKQLLPAAATQVFARSAPQQGAREIAVSGTGTIEGKPARSRRLTPDKRARTRCVHLKLGQGRDRDFQRGGGEED